MKRSLFSALLAAALALPAGAQSIQGVLVDPPNPTTRDHVRLTIVGTQHPECPLVFEGGAKDPAGSNIGFSTSFPECGSPLPAEEELRKTFEIDHPLELPGLYLAYVVVKNRPEANIREVFVVSEPSPRLTLGENGRFLAMVEWQNPRDGSHGAGYASPLSGDSGAFWFFDPDNLEVTIKILDGRPVNGHWWVFIASMTDLEMKVTIYENRDHCFDLPLVPPACPAETYVQAAGQNRNFVDVDAFGDSAAAAGLLALPAVADSIAFEPRYPTTLEPVHVAVSVETPYKIDPELRFVGVQGDRIVFEQDSVAAPNPSPPYTLWTAEATVGPLRKGFYTVEVMTEGFRTLQRTFEVTEPSPGIALLADVDSVFSVSVDFELPPGSSLRGTGFGVPLTRESGYFWFFDPDNIEVTVKILDGRAVNGRYWVFLASMTDLPFTATVTQCPTSPLVGAPCLSKQYRTEPGVNRNIIDVNFQGW
jgi:catechol 2,3-dioxygenase-like lactoylglutathione lyase family enzyme